jgi:hypothetical protein
VGIRIGRELVENGLTRPLFVRIGHARKFFRARRGGGVHSP